MEILTRHDSSTGLNGFGGGAVYVGYRRDTVVSTREMQCKVLTIGKVCDSVPALVLGDFFFHSGGTSRKALGDGNAIILHLRKLSA